ncbi:hypothetical protein [Natranaerofaba carboxydovora]|uniref:hypothetical protein n=1 Tax=Natranaerofaba carboxydovora TaxID=2742683 RepID=UPI001F14145E|nr:hypothetical protein [Natranaerofaba carboxydovora]UMZ73962.1 Stage III sporulation protein AB (spore_III_AB) [Natranaerofaba carboxydovora]
MIQIVGAGCLLFSTVGIGTKIAWTYRKRPHQLQQLEVQIRSLSSVIDYTATPIPEIFEDLASRYPKETGKIFSEISGLLNESQDPTISLEEAFKTCLEDLEHELSLTSADWEILESLFFNLGKSHRDDQIKLIELTLYQLKNAKNEAEEDRKKNEKMWRYLGVLAGLLLIVLFW